MYEEPQMPLSNGNNGLFTADLQQRLAGEGERADKILSGAVVVRSSGEVDPLRTLEWMGLRHRKRRLTLMGHLMLRNWFEVRAPLMDPDVLMYAMSLDDIYRAEEKPLHVGWFKAEAPDFLKITWQRTGRSIQGTQLENDRSAGKNWVTHKAQNCLAKLTGKKTEWTRNKLTSYHTWMVYDGNFRKFVRAVLMSPRTLERGLYSKNIVNRMLDEEFSDSRVHTELIGRMITLELAVRLFFDGDNELGK
jgi:hypothetical protein